MKKGQVMGMPLVLIFALIVGAIILIWGIAQIWSLVAFAGDVDLTDKIDDMRNDVDVFSNYDDGASKEYVLDFPSKIEVICVYDGTQAFNCRYDGEACPSAFAEDMEMIMFESSNVYFYPFEFDTTNFNVEDLKPEGGNPECIKNYDTALLKKTKDAVTLSYYE